MKRLSGDQMVRAVEARGLLQEAGCVDGADALTRVDEEGEHDDLAALKTALEAAEAQRVALSAATSILRKLVNDTEWVRARAP